jgi:hypothetical protein
VQHVFPLGRSKIKGKVDVMHATKAYRGVELQLRSFLTFALDGVGGHFHAHGRFNPSEGSSCTH